MGSTPPFDWSQFRLGIFVQRAQPLDLYALWSTPEGLTKWFVREADFAATTEPPPRSARDLQNIKPFDELTMRSLNEQCQTNDRYRWEWYYDGGIRGEQWILDARPPSRLVFGFGDRMTVEVTLRKQDGGCDVSLRQYNIPTTLRARYELHMGCRVAWAFFLTNLKSMSEHGIDLRETNTKRIRQLHLVNI